MHCTTQLYMELQRQKQRYVCSLLIHQQFCKGSKQGLHAVRSEAQTCSDARQHPSGKALMHSSLSMGCSSTPHPCQQVGTCLIRVGKMKARTIKPGCLWFIKAALCSDPHQCKLFIVTWPVEIWQALYTVGGQPLVFHIYIYIQFNLWGVPSLVCCSDYRNLNTVG